MWEGRNPCKYTSSFEKLEEQLLNKDKCFSSVTDQRIIDEGYEHVLKVENKFKMKTMRGCHELHLKCDVVLLKNYVLCLIHNLNAPALSWDAMLRMEKLSWNSFQTFECSCLLKNL